MTDEDRYLAAIHAMQSGVAYEMNYAKFASATEPKHLRVGVNNALVQQTAIVKLMVAKGIITMDEWWKTLADEMEAEVARYEVEIRQLLGHDGVKLR